MGDLDLEGVGVRPIVNGGYEDVDMTIGMVCMKGGQGCMILVQEST